MTGPTPTPNDTGIVTDYTLNPAQYVTTTPVELKSHKGNYSLYGRITVNGSAPPGYIYPLKPSDYNISESNEAVDTLGILEVSSVSASYKSITNSGFEGWSGVPLKSFIDSLGNYRIDGLNPGRMSFFCLRLCTPPGECYRAYYIHNDKGYGSINLNLTKDLSRCDLDLTDVKFLTRTSDRCDIYYCTGIVKSADL